MNLDFETIVVGAGVSGIGAGIALRKHGFDSSVILEAAEELGGTWRDNTYPGVAVDIPSISYCFSFEIDYDWSRTYAPGREILAYLQHCAKKYGSKATSGIARALPRPGSTRPPIRGRRSFRTPRLFVLAT